MGVEDAAGAHHGLPAANGPKQRAALHRAPGYGHEPWSPTVLDRLRQVAVALTCAGGAGAAAKTVVAPLERVKVLLQVQPMSALPRGEHYRGLADALRRIPQREGGWKALYRGNGANVLRLLPEVGFKFVVHDQFKVMFAPADGGPLGALEKVAAGAATGVLKTLLFYPLDLCRTRITADTSPAFAAQPQPQAWPPAPAQGPGGPASPSTAPLGAAPAASTPAAAPPHHARTFSTQGSSSSGGSGSGSGSSTSSPHHHQQRQLHTHGAWGTASGTSTSTSTSTSGGSSTPTCSPDRRHQHPQHLQQQQQQRACATSSSTASSSTASSSAAGGNSGRTSSVGGSGSGGGGRPMATVRGCLATTVRLEGVRALYKGLVLSMVGIVPYLSVQLTAYDTLKQHLPDDRASRQAWWFPLLVMGCGAAAAVTAQTATYPLDTVRRRMQLSGSLGQAAHYRGALDCVRQMVAREGVLSLYRGCGVNAIKTVPGAVVQFVMYDLIKTSIQVLDPTTGVASPL